MAVFLVCGRRVRYCCDRGGHSDPLCVIGCDRLLGSLAYVCCWRVDVQSVSVLVWFVMMCRMMLVYLIWRSIVCGVGCAG